MSHLTHCNQGEYVGGCKYGQAANCPALLDYPAPLCEFREDQWWVKELDAMAVNATSDQKRAIAVVHHMLKAVAAK